MSAKTRVPKNCLTCNGVFEPSSSLVRKGYGKFCRKECYGEFLSKTVSSDQMRFLGALRKDFIQRPEKSLKISIAKTGASRPDMQGANNWNWAGGITPLNQVIRNSPQYIQWRLSVFRRDKYSCQECGARSGNGQTVTLHADHIKQFAFFPELRFEVSNGRTLCAPCHRETPTYGRPKSNTQLTYGK